MTVANPNNPKTASAAQALTPLKPWVACQNPNRISGVVNTPISAPHIKRVGESTIIFSASESSFANGLSLG